MALEKLTRLNTLKRWGIATLASLALAGTAQAASLVILTENLDGNFFVDPSLAYSAQLGGGSSTATSGGPYAGTNGKTWGGNFFRNATGGGGQPGNLFQLSFGNLPSHTGVSIDFMLGFLDSWDSFNGSPAPDNLNLYIDGNLVATLTSNQASGTQVNYGGGTLIAGATQIDSNQFFSDVLVDMGSASFLNLAHTGSTLTFGIQAAGAGWQGGGDESWGIDSFSITLNGVGGGGNNVPEPASLALLGLGLAGLGFGRRKLMR
ncbi:PEP-CTERM sorting domain-containing protein [Accumulibacter sp.]|uniref:PEP-CTERM sorting domain-containing protein n=1 Tax=Accumulibacter sp. TaxID=2053492 RepID=UPI0025F9D32E|nr:PEP-CTERM sorting domain-containing protein [Accumulibacter sp.]MCM8610716.1 PEP-CTERM sorting domain-containing protein [Accumulibacter sp.]MCM8634610.1 PEP-CTERM sorting domain-containing protein [Accumulibacter sp.]MCM8638104.1 PEP-CTERM sorting domain-containing protein [Accumulibacter sp.]